MASLYSYHHYSSTTTTTLLMLLLLHHFFHLVSSFNLMHPAIPPRELLIEEKNKLGSIPPSCYSKCNECHPCNAVQVPSLPSHDYVLNHEATKVSTMKKWLYSSFQVGNRYSNYKPLGWKCHCGDHFFNP